MRFLQFSRNLAISSRLGFRNLVTSCRAVVVPRFGGPDDLEIRDHVKVPNLKPHKVLVKARTVLVNPLNLRFSRFGDRYKSGHDLSEISAYWWTYVRSDPEGLSEIRQLTEDGKLTIPVMKTYPITQVREAQHDQI